MNWYNWYKSVWEAIVAKVKGLDEFDDENTFFGEKFPPATFPTAYVCPGRAASLPATFTEVYWRPTFEIGVVVLDPDAKAGFLKAFELIGKITDAIEADRHLSDTVQNAICSEIIPYWRGFGHGVETHWVGVIITCEMKR